MRFDTTFRVKDGTLYLRVPFATARLIAQARNTTVSGLSGQGVQAEVIL